MVVPLTLTNPTLPMLLFYCCLYIVLYKQMKIYSLYCKSLINYFNSERPKYRCNYCAFQINTLFLESTRIFSEMHSSCGQRSLEAKNVNLLEELVESYFPAFPRSFIVTVVTCKTIDEIVTRTVNAMNEYLFRNNLELSYPRLIALG